MTEKELADIEVRHKIALSAYRQERFGDFIARTVVEHDVRRLIAEIRRLRATESEAKKA